MTLNEAQTRVLQIDPQLRTAGWKLNDRTLVERANRLREAQREALRQAEHLFGSLLHHAFGR
jgi:type I site-specific restriction endonuclease